MSPGFKQREETFMLRGETKERKSNVEVRLKASVNRKVILNVPNGNQARPSASPTQFSKTKFLTASCLQQKEIFSAAE